uniref:Uncharacterized protein n=1 Tax=Setaria italica TaxID=4555 RepID=K4A2T7_SETIT
MKDKADEISTALSNVQRELDIKTDAMENMLRKQKALEEELVENGAVLTVLRSEENLQAEILTLRDKLEMAMALSEENEAAAIEARQTAEISKIYAEEKEEEVKILERSVEELEGTVTVLEEEVCNLKEEVRSYQLHKQSEDQLQAVGDMLSVEKASKCDAAGELCQGKCHLEKRLQAEILAHQDVRKRIEHLTLEVKHKDDEIRQYKEHIAELVLHSEAQSLLYQEKICLLTSRLAAVDTMTHDIIRELLGVKLDMTNYANLLDQEELQKLLIASQQQIEQSKAKLEKDSLQQKIMEMDETMELLVGSNQPDTNLRMGDHGSSEFSRRLAQSDMLLSHARQEHSRSHATRSSRAHHGRYR